MVRNRKRVGLIAALAIVPLALAACGGTGSTKSSAGAASGATVLKLWHYEGPTG